MNAQLSTVVDSKALQTYPKVTAIRDTLLVLFLQVVFRTTQCLRSWNY